MTIKMPQKLLYYAMIVSSFFVFTSCSTMKVQTVAEETEANQIIDVMRQHGLNATKHEGGEGETKVYEIYVTGEEEYGAAIQLMDDHCLPQPVPPKIETSGIVSSIEVEKAQQLRRTKINIESQLRKIPGTTCVTVTIVPPEDRSLALNPYKSTATVLVKYKTEKYGLNVNQIARMIAGGVPGLSPDNVTVTLTGQPLRPLPDFNRGRNIRRIIYVSGIGLTTILLFIGFVIFLRKRNGNNEDGESELADDSDDLLEGRERANDSPLLENTEELDENSVEVSENRKND